MSGIYVKIAWRNVFRNRRRSFVVIGSVAVAVFAAAFMTMFMMGMADQMVEAAINSYLGHVQVHKDGWADNPVVRLSMTNPDSALEAAESADGIVEGIAPRVLSRGLAQSATNSSGVMIVGGIAERESLYTSVAERIIDGSFLTGQTFRRRQEIVVGDELAEKLGVEVGKKVILVAQAKGGDMGSAAFRVVGIFRMPSEDLNKTMVWVNLADAQSMLELGDGLSEVMVKLKPEATVAELRRVRDQISAALGGGYEVRTWRDASREMVTMVEFFDISVIIMTAIIFLGATFGIVNTMLMSVFERMREFGILRAIGTSPFALFRSVVYEAGFISILGLAAGSGLMALAHLAFWRDGLDLSMFEKSLAMFGSDAVIQASFPPGVMISVAVLVIVMTVLASLWPAMRAARLQPVETMRQN